MDNRQSNSSQLDLHLFSRGSTPPIQGPMNQPQSYSQSTTSLNSPPNHIDSLFQNLSPAMEPSHSIHQQTQRYQQQVGLETAPDSYTNNSAPTTPSMSLIDHEPAHISPANANTTNAERQSALLSLLGAPPAGSTNARQAPPQGQQGSLPQQVPTPPGSSQRSGQSPSHAETQGKFLLEQLMAGQAPRVNPNASYADSPHGSFSGTSSSPTYVTLPREGEYSMYGGPQQHDPAIEYAERGQEPLRQQLPPSPPQPQQQPPSPRKSMFDFVSPFDVLSTTTSTGSVRKKPVPSIPSVTDESNGSWTQVSDPKRQSVDNLLDNLTKQAPPQPAVSQGPHSQPQGYSAVAPPAYDLYSGDQYASDTIYGQPLPPQASVKNVSAASATHLARGPSPPKGVQGHGVPTRGPGGRFIESPASQTSSIGHGRRDKESSPGPRGGPRNKAGPPLQAKGGNKYEPRSSPQAQTIVFDVSLPQEGIQAHHDFVKPTAIALVRQDPVFLPGTTIGATHWVAYAMTKGRVRVISRASGDRTLLQLPSVFPPTSSVCDMAVYKHRLAGVTTDGGLVVWELPDTITDDVPGDVLLCVPPSNDDYALKSIKWHPKDADTLAVASSNQIFIFDLANIRGETVMPNDLHHFAQDLSVPSTIAAFDWDVLHYALATISVDSTLMIWNIHDKVPYTTHKIRGDDVPSSLTFVDGGIVVGRKNGTVLQLLSITNKLVLSTIKFINGSQDDPDMFGHVSYDSRIQTLWVANCRRESLIAFRINLESTVVGGEEAVRGYFDQVVEFAGPKPSINFVILTADADPTGEEAYAACHAAKIPAGDLALVAFSVHSSGVDQVLVRKEWFDTAFLSAPAKFPPNLPLPAAPAQAPPPPQNLPVQAASRPLPPVRARTPPSEELEPEPPRDEPRAPEPKKGPKVGKNVNFKEKEKEREDIGKEKDRNAKAEPIINDSALGLALSKEIKKTEENLQTKLGRLISREMDKQSQRLDDIRAQDQRSEFSRQETMLKLISTELSKNTTRVVEMAIKGVITNSVLPSLENITKTEVKSALDEHIGRGFVELIGDTLPVEMEKLLLRQDITAHFSHILMSTMTPVIERQVKDSFSKTILQQTSAMHQELLHDLRSDLHKIKSDLIGWQNDALRNQEASIRDLDRTVRSLADQVKFLTMNPPSVSSQQPPRHSSPAPHSQPIMDQSRGMLPQQAMGPPPPPANYMGYQNYPQAAGPSLPPPSWHSAPIVAPQASVPATIPQPPQSERTPPVKPEQWDDLYLEVLHSQDSNKLRELLAQSNPELILPLNRGPPLVSQAVILTLVHRLAAIIGEVGETNPTDEAFKTSLWWLQRCVTLLRPQDKLIADFIPRVIPNVQSLLSTTNRRLAILPVGPQTRDAARTLSEIQEALRRKAVGA